MEGIPGVLRGAFSIEFFELISFLEGPKGYVTEVSKLLGQFSYNEEFDFFQRKFQKQTSASSEMPHFQIRPEQPRGVRCQNAVSNLSGGCYKD